MNVQVNKCCFLFCLDSNSYNCICNEKYVGNKCQYKLDYCFLNKPCGPYGECIILENEEYMCSCQQGFTGKK
jgi:hypothetical protein